MSLSSALTVGSTLRALLVGAPVLGALAAALAATGGLYFQRLNRREAYRKDAAKAIESTRGITRRLERFAYQERPDAAEIESVRQDWEKLIRNELTGFAASQPSETIRRDGRGLAVEIDDALEWIRRASAAETHGERDHARGQFRRLEGDFRRQINNLRIAAGIGGESRQADAPTRDELPWWRAYPGEPEEWRPFYRLRTEVGRILGREDDDDDD